MQDDHLSERRSLKNVHETIRVVFVKSGVTNGNVRETHDPTQPRNTTTRPGNKNFETNAGDEHVMVPGWKFQEMNQMKRSSIIMLIASAVLVAGMLVAGCTQDAGSASGQTSTTASPSAGQAQAVGTTVAGDSGGVPSSVTPGQASTGDKPQFNQSAGSKGTPPGGMQMNGTRPSGTPPEGMQMNGTHPSGTPPSGTPPAGS